MKLINLFGDEMGTHFIREKWEVMRKLPLSLEYHCDQENVKGILRGMLSVSPSPPTGGLGGRQRTHPSVIIPQDHWTAIFSRLLSQNLSHFGRMCKECTNLSINCCAEPSISMELYRSIITMLNSIELTESWYIFFLFYLIMHQMLNVTHGSRGIYLLIYFTM